MYFKNFSKIDYDVTGTGETYRVTDIITRITVRKLLINNSALFTKYVISEDESPEKVALKFYEQVDLHWIVLLFNNYFDRYYEWPMSIRVLQKYIFEKYKEPYDIHHWEMPQKSGDKNVKITVDYMAHPSVVGVTNIEYETELNDKRRSISILEPTYISAFISEFKNLI